MKIETIVVGPYEVNCYVASADSNEAVIIDPGADADDILNYLRTNRLKPLAYLLTHGHADHIGALNKLLTAHPAPALMHAEDQRWAFTERNQIPPFYPAQYPPPATLQGITDGEELLLAGIKFKVIATPGHTPGGVCFFVPDAQALFCGDTLFQGTVGRTDLPGGDGRILAQSLKKLAALPPETHVFPGHGPETTIGEERHTNIYFRSPA
jgi:glyoxylase-like metal-dependent hydrolase (beta-lactamase superfamily II)